MLLPSTLQMLFKFWQLSQNLIGCYFWTWLNFFLIIRVMLCFLGAGYHIHDLSNACIRWHIIRPFSWKGFLFPFIISMCIVELTVRLYKYPIPHETFSFYHYGLTDLYGLWCIYCDTRVVHRLASRSPFKLALCPFDISPLFFEHFLFFWHYKYISFLLLP